MEGKKTIISSFLFIQRHNINRVNFKFECVNVRLNDVKDAKSGDAEPEQFFATAVWLRESIPTPTPSRTFLT